MEAQVASRRARVAVAVGGGGLSLGGGGGGGGRCAFGGRPCCCVQVGSACVLVVCTGGSGEVPAARWQAGRGIFIGGEGKDEELTTQLLWRLKCIQAARVGS